MAVSVCVCMYLHLPPSLSLSLSLSLSEHLSLPDSLRPVAQEDLFEEMIPKFPIEPFAEEVNKHCFGGKLKKYPKGRKARDYEAALEFIEACFKRAARDRPFETSTTTATDTTNAEKIITSLINQMRNARRSVLSTCTT